jgi:hypothetical protein
MEAAKVIDLEDWQDVERRRLGFGQPYAGACCVRSSH